MALFLHQLALCAPLFLLVFVGWGLRKAHFFGDDVAAALTTFTFRFLMPALLFDMLSDLSEMPPVDWRVLFAFFGSCLVLFSAGKLLYPKLFGVTAAGSTILAMAGVFGNNVQLGIPILQLGLGEAAMPTASLLIIFNVLILWTVAIASVEFGREDAAAPDAAGKGILARVVKSAPALLRVVKNPVVAGILAGTAFGLTGWTLPGVARDALGLVSGATTPICLIVVGMGLARHSFFGAIAKNAVVTTVKLLIQPGLVWLLCRLIGLPTLETQVATLMATLPVAVNVFIMSADFKAEEGAASSAILLSTLLSSLTLLLVLTLLGAGARGADEGLAACKSGARPLGFPSAAGALKAGGATAPCKKAFQKRVMALVLP